MALIIFAQSLGPAIVLVLCNVIFISSLTSQLHEKVSDADTEGIIRAGATGFRAILRPEELPPVLAAYANSVDSVFYLVAAVATACSIVLWGMGWIDLRKKRDEIDGEKDPSDQHDL
jgi:hypothetical protein